MAPDLNVGGQAVIEGVMMRSPRSFAVAVRRRNGDIVLREGPWHSIWERFRFLRWPFVRGGVVLVEALHNGMSALTFAANQAAEDDIEEHRAKGGDGRAPDAPKELSKTAMTLTIVAALGIGLLFFLVLPHYLTWLLGVATGVESLKDGQSAPFHVVDGIIKLAFFVTYVWLISKIPDIRRVFQYHGAEHKAIYAYENGEALTVENAQKYTTLHPRCGTSFILIVVMMSILVFFAVLPWIPAFSEKGWLNQMLLVFLKIPLMFPIAGLAYETQKLSAKASATNPFVRALIWPGLMLQKITTQEPTDAQVEVALVAVRKVLLREKSGAPAPSEREAGVERFGSFDDFLAAA